ncbi:MAG: hypothetical protein ACLPWS_20350 [Rhodomicrobium sp.]
MSSTTASLPGSIAPASGISATKTAVWIFAILGAIYLVWPVWRMGFPLDANINEGWHGWYIDSVLKGQPLYPGPHEMRVNNYPPLSFYLTAAVAKLTGDAILAGRLLSLASLFVLSAAAGISVRALGGSRAAAAFGAVWLFATLAQFFQNYVAVNDPSLLAVALAGLGLAYFLHCLRARRAVEPAIALMVIAGFFKHNFPGIPLAALIWLALIDKRAALRAALFGAALTFGGLLLCAAAFGPDFATQMLMPREMTFRHVLMAVNRLQWIAPAVAAWALWAWRNRTQPAAQFTALLIGITLVNGLGIAAGAGVTYNAYLALTFASVIGIGLAIEGFDTAAIARRFSGGAARVTIVAVLLLRLVLSQHYEFYLVLASPSFREDYRQHAAALNAEIARIRSIPGPVSCQPISLCYRAGKDFVYERYWVQQLIATGRLTQDAVDQAIPERGIRFEAADPSIWVRKRLLF